TLTPEVTLTELVPLDHGGHRPVEDEDALAGEAAEERGNVLCHEGPFGVSGAGCLRIVTLGSAPASPFGPEAGPALLLDSSRQSRVWRRTRRRRPSSAGANVPQISSVTPTERPRPDSSDSLSAGRR